LTKVDVEVKFEAFGSIKNYPQLELSNRIVFKLIANK